MYLSISVNFDAFDRIYRCGHCKAMAEDWVQLGKAMADEKPDLLVAEG